MPTVEKDITIKEGARFTMILHVKNADGTVFTTLPSYTGRCEVRAAKNTESELLLTMMVTVDDPIQGDVKVQADADTEVPTGTQKFRDNGFYDVEIVETASPGNVLRLAQGRALADTNVTD